MTTLINLKLNSVLNELKSIEDTTANQDVLNAVIAYMNDNPAQFQPDIDMTKLNQFVEKYLNDNSNLFEGKPGPPVSESDITEALSTYFKSNTAVNFINATFKNLVCGNTTLQFYDSATQTSQQMDITSKKVDCTAITLSEINGKSNGSVLSQEIEIKVNNLLNALQGLKTTLLTTDSLVLNQLFNVGRNNLYNNSISSLENDLITEYFQTHYLNGKNTTINLIDGLPTNYKSVVCNDTLVCKKGIVATQIYCDYPPGITNARVLQIGINDNDNLIVRAGASFRKSIFCGNNLFNANLTGSTDIDFSTNNLVATNISNRGSTINFQDAVNFQSNLSMSDITCKSISGIQQDSGYKSVSGLQTTDIMTCNIFKSKTVFKDIIYASVLFPYTVGNNNNMFIGRPPNVEFPQDNDNVIFNCNTNFLSQVQFADNVIFNNALTVSNLKNTGESKINILNDVNMTKKTLTLDTLIVEGGIVYRQGLINPRFGIANDNINTNLSGTLEIIDSTWTTQISLITSNIVLDSPIITGFRLARPAGSIFGFCNNTLPPTTLNINYLCSNGQTRNFETIKPGHTAMFLIAGYGYSRIAI